jgi:hypothetical protein
VVSPHVLITSIRSMAQNATSKAALTSMNIMIPSDGMAYTFSDARLSMDMLKAAHYPFSVRGDGHSYDCLETWFTCRLFQMASLGT